MASEIPALPVSWLVELRPVLYLTSVSLHFSICKVGTITTHTA